MAFRSGGYRSRIRYRPLANKTGRYASRCRDTGKLSRFGRDCLDGGSTNGRTSRNAERQRGNRRSHAHRRSTRDTHRLGGGQNRIKSLADDRRIRGRASCNHDRDQWAAQGRCSNARSVRRKSKKRFVRGYSCLQPEAKSHHRRGHG